MADYFIIDSAISYIELTLNMIYPRLKVARDLLTYDGVIFISIDDNEQDNLRKVCLLDFKPFPNTSHSFLNIPQEFFSIVTKRKSRFWTRERPESGKC